MHYLVLNSRSICFLVCGSITITPCTLQLVTETNNHNTSDSALYNIGNTSSRLQSQTVTFRDGPSQWSNAMSSVDDETRFQTVHGDVSLSEFFARPIPITSTIWTPGVPFVDINIDPWSLYINNPRVANRMTNYALFSGKLHVKIMLNGNSFYYGRLMSFYKPLGTDDGGLTIDGTEAGIMQGSQKLKLFVDPCESQGGELELPFMWPYDMVSLPLGDYDQLGRLAIVEVNPLKHANGAVSPVTITLFAWMTDVKLSAPTQTDIPGLVAQAADEYGATPVSYIASTAAGLAGRLTNMPIIGRYMRATQIGAGAMANIARLFGFSRPTIISPPMVMRHRNIGELAVTDCADTVNKLTVDSKQELSIDPAIVGVGKDDEMKLADIAAKETYVAKFSWPTSATPNTCLWTTRVTPNLCQGVVDPIGTKWTIPACYYAAFPFRYWRGIMKFRFQIVASSYHKGRLLFTWDPISAATVPETNVVYSKIVDLSQERDFTLDVPWGNPSSWLTTVLPSNATYRATPPFASNAIGSANGVVTVYVLNDLTTPNSDVNNDVEINFFVSMCNAEFAAPDDKIKIVSPLITPLGGAEVVSETPLPVVEEGDVLVSQSDVETSQMPDDNAPTQSESTESMIMCDMEFGKLSSVYFGETISSFRSMMKRYAVDWVWSFVTATAAIGSFSTGDFPMSYNYTPYGQFTIPFGSYDTANTTMMRYLAMGFIAYRGGIRRKYMSLIGNTLKASGMIAVKRNTVLTYTLPSSTAYPVTANGQSVTSLSLYPSGLEGQAIISTEQNRCVEVELPSYRTTRFALTRRPYTPPNSNIPYVEDLTHTVVINKATSTVDQIVSLVSAAEDSSFFCFQGCQSFYLGPNLAAL